MAINGTVKYVFDVKVLESKKVTMKFQVTLQSSKFGMAKEGKWLTSGPYLKQSSGHWKCLRSQYKNAFAPYLIVLKTEDDSGLISAYFGSAADVLMDLSDLTKFPPFVGETGYGQVWPGGGQLAPSGGEVAWQLASKA